MPNLRFNHLSVISNTQKSANQFKFHNKLNLITADDNSVGKSSLVKLLFWSLGCDFEWDTKWIALDVRTHLNFSIGDTEYDITRHKNLISLKFNSLPIEKYIKITGAYSERVAELLGFKALLPKRDSDILEVPPPAYYFLPFYVDQKKSWIKAWDNFKGLAQYERWQPTIIKYHIGLFPPEHFELEQEKYANKRLLAEVKSYIEKIKTTLGIIKPYIPKINGTINQKEFEVMTSEIQHDLKELVNQQEATLDLLSKAEAERVNLEHQINITKEIILELDKDYKFAVENIEGDDLECPLCGTHHDNSLINRTSILTDQQQAESQLDTLNELHKKNIDKIEKTKKNLQEIKNRISYLNEKYIIEEDGNKIDLGQIIDSFAARSIQQNVINSKSLQLNKKDELKRREKEIKKEQEELLSLEVKEEINNQFNSFFADYINELDAQGVNLSIINSPMDYNKVFREGGAAEGTRGILAYYMAIFQLTQKFGSGIVSPFVIDTPNQQEQSDVNYEKIISIIINDIGKKTQTFLCAKENPQLDDFKQIATVFYLDEENKLFLKDQYEPIKKAIDSVFKE